MKLSNIALRNIFRNKKRSILSGLAIAIASLAIVLLYAYIGGMKKDLVYNLQTYYTGQIRIQHEEYEKYDYLNPLHLRVESYDDILQELEKIEEVELISPRLYFPTRVYRDEVTYNSFVMGVDLTRELKYQPMEEDLISGRLPAAGENEILIGEDLALELGVDINDKISLWTMTMRRSSNLITYQITGIIKFPLQELNKRIIMSIDRAQRLVQMDDSVSEIIMKLQQGASGIETAEKLRTLFAELERDELQIKAIEEISTTYSLIEVAEKSYDFMAFFFFVLASSVIVSTTMMVVYERMREIGTISAMGMTGPEIVRLFFLESFFISIIGSFIGVMLGILISIPLQQGIDISAVMQSVDFESSGIIKFQLNFKSTIFVFIFSVIVASLASLIPSIRSSKIEPVEALRDI